MTIRIRQLGLTDYADIYQGMHDFTDRRIEDRHDLQDTDECWLLQHRPVYTLGLSGQRSHLLNIGNIPVLETDRGGQVTYHGPGQLIAYLMLNLSVRSYSIKQMVVCIEQAIMDYLQSLGINADRRRRAPGVYVEDKKIAALGIRVRRGYSYHGLALNVDMDLSPFSRINPCGYAGLRCTQISDYVTGINIEQVMKTLPQYIMIYLGQKELRYSDVA